MMGRTRDSGRFHVDQQERNALLRTPFGAGAHQAEYPVGVLAQGVPGFLAVDDVVIALAHGAGAQRGQVGAGARFGISLAPPILAGRECAAGSIPAARRCRTSCITGASIFSENGVLRRRARGRPVLPRIYAAARRSNRCRRRVDHIRRTPTLGHAESSASASGHPWRAPSHAQSWRGCRRAARPRKRRAPVREMSLPPDSVRILSDPTLISFPFARRHSPL